MAYWSGLHGSLFSLFGEQYHVKKYDVYETSLPGKIHSWYYTLKDYGKYMLRGQVTVRIQIDSNVSRWAPVGIVVTLSTASGLTTDQMKKSMRTVYIPDNTHIHEMTIEICTVLDYTKDSYNPNIIITFFTLDRSYQPNIYGKVNNMTMMKIQDY